MDSFYNSIGGLAGYQLKCLEMMLGSKKDSPAEQLGSEPSVSAGEATKYHMPQGLNIAYNRRAAAAAAATGLEALPHMGEILPLGGPPQSAWPCKDMDTASGRSLPSCCMLNGQARMICAGRREQDSSHPLRQMPDLIWHSRVNWAIPRGHC